MQGHGSARMSCPGSDSPTRSYGLRLTSPHEHTRWPTANDAVVQKWKPLLKTLDFDPWEVDEDDTLILGFEMFAELGAHSRMGKLARPCVLGYGCVCGPIRVPIREYVGDIG